MLDASSQFIQEWRAQSGTERQKQQLGLEKGRSGEERRKEKGQEVIVKFIECGNSFRGVYLLSLNSYYKHTNKQISVSHNSVM